MENRPDFTFLAISQLIFVQFSKLKNMILSRENIVLQYTSEIDSYILSSFDAVNHFTIFDI